MKNSKLHTFIWLLLPAFAASMMFSGCNKEAIEQQNNLKETAIEEMGSGAYEDALTHINEALRLANGRVSRREIDLCYYKGADQYLLGDAAGAIETYGNVIAYDGKDKNAYFLRGSLYLKEKDTEKALSDYKNAVAVSGDDYEMYIQIYENLAASGLREEAMEFLNLALEIEGDSANNLYWRGRIYLILEQNDAAIKVLTSSAEKGNKEANIYLAKAYRAAGNEDKANEILINFANSEEVSAETYGVMADILAEQGNYPEALNAIESGLAIENAKNKKQLMKNKIGVLENMCDYTGAFDAANDYLLDYPADADVLDEVIFLNSRI